MWKKVFRRQAYYIASVAFIVLGLLYFIVTINQPYIGLNMKDINGQWFVTTADPNGEGYQAGIRVGDIVLKINEDVSSRYHNVKKWSQAEGASSIEFRKSDQPTNIFFKLPIRTDWLRYFEEIPLKILGFVFGLMGFITWFKRPFLVQARALFWLNWIIGLAIVFAPASSRSLLFARELEYISMSLFPVFLINLVSVFPKDNRNRTNRFSRHIFVIIAIIIIIFTILQSNGIIDNVSLLRKLVMSNVIIALLLALGNLGLLIKLPKDNPERNQAGILFLGIVIGFFPFVLLTAVPQLFNFQPIRFYISSSLFMSFVPVAWYYVIVNKYLPDSRRLFEKIISFLVTGIIVSFVVSYILYFLKLVTTLNLEVYLALLFLTILFIACISFIRVVISKLLGKSGFFKDTQGLVLKLNESLNLINEEERILEEVVKRLAIEGAFIVIEDRKGGYRKKAVGRFLRKPSKQIELEEFFQADQKIDLKAEILPETFSAEIYVPVVYDNYSCGIFLGHRYSRIKFEQAELPLITLISSQLAQRLIMMFVIKELTKEIKLLDKNSQESQRRNQELQRKVQGLQGSITYLFRIIEQEKRVIASAINHGALRLGLDLNSGLKYLNDECQIGDDKAVRAISHMREQAENLNYELRLIAEDLRPLVLRLGLYNAVELLCDELMIKELTQVSLEIVGMDREDRFKEEIELVAYSFLQKGIRNSVIHSGFYKVWVNIEMIGANLELTVIDRSMGFDTSKIIEWLMTGTHFGIAGMKERIESLGGNLRITSGSDPGTTLKATIPVI